MESTSRGDWVTLLADGVAFVHEKDERWDRRAVHQEETRHGH